MFKKMGIMGFLVFVLLHKGALYAENRAVHLSGDDAEKLYSALTTKEVLRSGVRNIVYDKALSGLTCVRDIQRNLPDVFTCELEKDLSQTQLLNIYLVIDKKYEESKASDTEKVVYYLKSVGSLTFQKTVRPLPSRPYYEVIIGKEDKSGGFVASVSGFFARDIYRALRVKSKKDKNTPISTKEVGPLVCVRKDFSSYGADIATRLYYCRLSGEATDNNSATVRGPEALSIYEALKVEAEEARGIHPTLTKRVGSLECHEVATGTMVGYIYSCRLVSYR